MLVTHALQVNPKTFQDPLVFNPWRWKDCDICCGFITLWCNLLSQINIVIRKYWFNFVTSHIG